MRILISGALAGAENVSGVKAVLVALDTESGELETFHEYLPPAHLDAKQKIQFTGYAFDGELFYICVFNEILCFRGWPPGEPFRRISLPGFNDLHHCALWRGGLAVANTGLETVDHVDLNGDLIDRWDLLEGMDRARTIDPNLDYRLLPDTKPHLVHANHVFEMDGELWVTQLRASNAVCVTRPGREISMKVGMPHDGSRFGDERVFTTVNGKIILCDADSGDVRKRIDLVDITPGRGQLGWCRGILRHPDEPGCYFISFSKTRRTKWKEFGYWLKHGHECLQSRVCLYDLEKETILETWLVGEDPGLVIFQLGLMPGAWDG